MSHASFIWASLSRRPLQTLMMFTCITFAYILYGLSLGLAEGFRRAALAQQAVLPQPFLLGAITVSAAGIALILFLVANAAAQAVRLRLREFGLLHALGFSHGHIIMLLVAEAAVPCLAGAATGLIVARLLFAALSELLPPFAVFPSPVYTLTMLVAGCVIALLIAVLSAIVPALRIIRLDAAAVLTGSYAARPRRPEDVEHNRNVAAVRSTANTGEALAVADQDLRLLRQVAVTFRIGLSTLRQRSKGGLLVAASVGGMVFVLLSILSMGEGIRTGMLDGADSFRVVVRPASNPWLHYVRLPDGIAVLAAAAPGVAHAPDGAPLAEAAIYDTIGKLTKRNNGESDGNTTVVGVGPHWADMTPSFRLLTGRMPRSGSRELVAGPRALRKFSSLDSGVVQYRGEEWRIVGTFTTGTWWDGFLVGPGADVRRHAGLSGDSAVLVRLTSPQAFDGFRDALAASLPTTVTIEREHDFYASYWRSIPKNAVYLAALLTIVFGAGAITSMTHVMHAAVQERSRETATLRVLGFSGVAVAASVVLEGMLLALLGTLCGGALAWIWLDGFLYNGAWTVFEVAVNPRLALIGAGLAFSIALMGTLPLAVRTARQRELEALQNLREMAQAQCLMPSLVRMNRAEHSAPQAACSASLARSVIWQIRQRMLVRQNRADVFQPGCTTIT